MDPSPKPHGGARPNSGGRRPGAGRPRLTDNGLERVVVSLTPTQIGAMVRLGPTISAAIRQVIDESGAVL